MSIAPIEILEPGLNADRSRFQLSLTYVVHPEDDYPQFSRKAVGAEDQQVGTHPVLISDADCCVEKHSGKIIANPTGSLSMCFHFLWKMNLVVCFGAFITGCGDLDLNARGYAFALASCVLQALYLVLAARARDARPEITSVAALNVWWQTLTFVAWLE